MKKTSSHVCELVSNCTRVGSPDGGAAEVPADAAEVPLSVASALTVVPVAITGPVGKSAPICGHVSDGAAESAPIEVGVSDCVYCSKPV